MNKYMLLLSLTVSMLFANNTNITSTSSATNAAPQRITVIAKKQPLDPKNSSGQISIIDSGEIEASGATSTAELIAPLLGVQIQKYGGASQPTVVSIRASSPEQVLILINGQKLNSAGGGGVDLSTINTTDIKRIEVIRGGGSSIYGENAIGGVVNIITKDGYGKKKKAYLEYGQASFNTHNISCQFLDSFLNKKIDIFIGASGLYTKGNYIFEDLNSDDGWNQRKNESGISGNFSGKIGWDINPKKGIRLAVSSTYHKDKKGVPGMKEYPTTNAIMKNDNLTGSLSFHFLKSKLFSFNSTVHYLSQQRIYSNSNFINGVVNDKHKYQSSGIDIHFSRSDRFKNIHTKNKLSYYLNYDRLNTTAMLISGDTITENADVDRILNSIAYLSELHLFPFKNSDVGHLSLFPSIRADINTIYKNRVSANLGIIIPLDDKKNNLLKANIGNGYRLPSFNDLFWPATAMAIGNPDLKPEEALILDVGLLSKPLPFFSFEVVFFRHDVNNLIQWNPGADGSWRPANIGSALIRGVETEISFLFNIKKLKSFLEIKGNYHFIFATDTTKESVTYGKQLPRKPYEKMNILLTLSHLKGHSLRMEANYTGFKYSTAMNTKHEEGYLLLNSILNVRFLKKYTLNMKVKNIFNKSYIDIRGYPIPGREYRISIRGEFK